MTEIRISPTRWLGNPEVVVWQGGRPIFSVFVTDQGKPHGWVSVARSTFDLSEYDIRRCLNNTLGGFAMFKAPALEDAA